MLRDYYKTTPWYKELETAKTEGKTKIEWPKPKKAPKELLKIVSNMYKSVADAWTGEKKFKAPPIKKVVQEYKKFLEKQKKN